MGNNEKWNLARGHMMAAAEYAEKLAVVVGYLQDINRQGIAVNVISEDIATTARDLADLMVNAIRNAVTAKNEASNYCTMHEAQGHHCRDCGKTWCPVGGCACPRGEQPVPPIGDVACQVEA